MNFLGERRKVIHVDVGEMSLREAEEYMCKLRGVEPPTKFKRFLEFLFWWSAFN
jgi:hypothetical protein